jgi:hypothetical protein
MENNNLPQQLASAFCKYLREEIRLILNELLRNESTTYRSHSSKALTQKAIFRRIGWIQGENILSLLHSILYSYGYISCDYPTFKSHFIGLKYPTECLLWHAETVKLVYLFYRLVEEGFIPIHGYPHSLLQSHFKDKKGHCLKNGSLRSSLNNAKNNKRIKIIEAIIQQLLKIKK